MDLLRPADPSDSPAVVDARGGLSDLLGELSPAAAELTVLWRDRLDRPSQAAGLLEELEETYRHELRWLYATRNMTLHSGKMTAPGESQLAIAASGFADLALEFLGSWYGTANAVGLKAKANKSPKEVVDELAQRRKDIADHLRQGNDLHRLHAEHLTSCTSDGWDRS